jgi:hypothetical protein
VEVFENKKEDLVGEALGFHHMECDNIGGCTLNLARSFNIKAIDTRVR